jgi:hypothetical protein
MHLRRTVDPCELKINYYYLGVISVVNVVGGLGTLMLYNRAKVMAN